MKTNTLYSVLTGSNLYNISTPDSDRDIKGIFAPTEEELLGLHSCDRIEGSNGKEGKEKEEWVFYSIKRYFELCLKSNPTIIELAFADDKYVINKCELSDLINSYVRKNFITKKLFGAFYGYAQDQIKMIETGKARRKEKRYDIVEKYGYDTKNAGHAYRLVVQAIDLIKNGTCNPTLQGEPRDIVMSIRNGDLRLEQVLQLIHDKVTYLESLYKSCNLIEMPDYDKANKFVIQIHKELLH